MKLYYKSMKNLLLLYLIIKENLKTDLPNTNIHSKTNLKEMQPLYLHTSLMPVLKQDMTMYEMSSS